MLHTDGSIVFARWRQCAPPMYYTPIGIRTVLVPVLSHFEYIDCYMFVNVLRWPILALKIALLTWGSGPQSNAWFLGQS